MSLYTRPIQAEEGQALLRLVHRSKNVITCRRAEVVLASVQGMAVQEIVEYYHFHEQYVRKIIRDFNKYGFDALKPKKSTGRPPEFTEEHRSLIIELALTPPQALGLPFTQWSIPKLMEEAIRRGIVKEISDETIRLMLKENKISYQRTKTWKESNDPEFDAKKNVSKNSTTLPLPMEE